MKKTLLTFFLVGMIAGACYAETLTTALPLGQDNTAVQVYNSSTPVKLVSENISAFGLRVFYGLSDELDLYGKLGLGSYGGASATPIGIGCKYSFLKTSDKFPADMAAMFGIDTTSGKDISMSIISIGVVASRYLKNNFTLYGSISALQNTAKYTGSKSLASNDIQWGVGAKYQATKALSFSAELMMFSIAADYYQTFSIAGQYNL